MIVKVIKHHEELVKMLPRDRQEEFTNYWDLLSKLFPLLQTKRWLTGITNHLFWQNVYTIEMDQVNAPTKGRIIEKVSNQTE